MFTEAELMSLLAVTGFRLVAKHDFERPAKDGVVFTFVQK